MHAEACGNLFDVPDVRLDAELVESIASGAGVAIERIVSTGQATGVGEWLEQQRDEWVVLLDGEAELSYDDGTGVRLSSGDYVLIAAGVRHRVEWTRTDPPCVWLAVHADHLRVGSAR
jgi:cupin 2 domain-containing protein